MKHFDSILVIHSKLIPVFEFGGIESPLIVTPVLSDDNYLGFSYWNISTSHLRVDAKELSNIKIKDKKHTGKNNSSELSGIIHGETDIAEHKLTVVQTVPLTWTPPIISAKQ